MPLRRFGELASLAAGLPGFLRSAITVGEAAASVRQRVDRRETLFLEAADSLIYGSERSPVRRLLLHAGCEAGDLRKAVTLDGIEMTLARLRREGVYFSSEELRGREPVRRGSFVMDTEMGDFDGTTSRGGIRGATSGSTGPAIPVRYTWPFLAEEAENELLLLDSHGVAHAALALWMPGPPGIAGLHNLLLHARAGRPPERWFSPTRCEPGAPFTIRMIDGGVQAASRLLPGFGPSPEWAPYERPDAVIRWLTGVQGPAVLKAFASSVTRIASIALESTVSLEGKIAFAGGEPLSSRARAVIASAGLKVYPRYVATETGLIAGGCPSNGDAMHLYSDRLAVIATNGGEVSELAFTSLSPHSPRVLFNAELGDQGRLSENECGCALGRAGLSRFVSDVSSPEKVGAAGVKLWMKDFEALVVEAVIDLGGDADAFQIWLDESDAATSRIRIALLPDSPLDAGTLLVRVREALPRLPAGALASLQWRDTGALTVIRANPRLSAGQKMLRVVRRAVDDES